MCHLNLNLMQQVFVMGPMMLHQSHMLFEHLVSPHCSSRNYTAEGVSSDHISTACSHLLGLCELDSELLMAYVHF